IGHLVGVAFRDGLGCEDVTLGSGHGLQVPWVKGRKSDQDAGLRGGKLATRPRPGNAEWGSRRRTSMYSPTTLRSASETSSALAAESADSAACRAAGSGTVRTTHLTSGSAGGDTLNWS